MKKVIGLIFLSLVFFTNSVSSQVVDEDVLERAKMTAEIQKLRTENEGLRTQVTELKAQITIASKMNDVQEGRIRDLKEALKYSREANNINFTMENLYKAQITDYKGEVDRLRSENAGLRKSRDRQRLIFGAIGLIAGKFLF